MFQSRNRVSSNFNYAEDAEGLANSQSFNLVIEYLLISSYELGYEYHDQPTCFNLVIEYLLISTAGLALLLAAFNRFQSRNRVSSNFNKVVKRFEMASAPLVSIS